MRKWIVALLIAVLAAAPAVYAAEAAHADAAHRGWVSPTVLVEDEPVDSPTPPFIERGTTLAPAIPYLSALGFTVTWDAQNGIVLAGKPDLALRWEIGSPEALVQTVGSARTFPLPLAARVVDGVPYVPLRFAAEADRRPVEWRGEDRTVLIGAVQEDAPATAVRVRIAIPVDDEANSGATAGALAKLADLVRERTGIETEWIMVPRIMYLDKLHLMLASGDIPDLAYMPDPSMYPAGLLASVAVELSDLIGDYPNVSLSLRHADAFTADDGLYGVPKVVSPADAVFPVIRQDWLDRLGLAVPATMDELYQVIKLFTNSDPDGNGIHDTVGLTGSIEGGNLGSLAWVGHVFNGAPTRFVREGDRIVDTTMLDGTRDALLWLRRAYTERILDVEFPVLTGMQALNAVQSGRAGIAAMRMTDVWPTEAALRKTADTAALTPLVSLKRDDDGPATASARPALDGMFIIGKQAKNPDAAARQALAVLDALLAPETEVALDVELEAALETVFGVNAPHELPNPRIPAPVRERYERILSERTPIIRWSAAVFEPEIRVRLDNDRKALKQDVDREIDGMMVKVIVGAEPIEAWDAFIAALRDDERYVAVMEAINGSP